MKRFHFHFSIGLHALATLFLLVVLFALPVLAMAQEATEAAQLPDTVPSDMSDVEIEDGTIVPNPAVEEQLETVFTNLVRLLWNAAYLPFAAPMVVVSVALLKRLPLAVSSSTWAFASTIVLWLLYLGATQLGFANQFETVISSLATIGASILGVTITPVLASNLHALASANRVPVLGYSKTPILSATVQTIPDFPASGKG